MVRVLNCKKSNFEGIINDKNVICIGCGKGLYEVLKKYPFLAPKISCIVDNYKNGCSLVYSEYKIPVVSVLKLEKIPSDTICVITTLLFSKEILNQLDEIPAFNNVPVYVPDIFGDNEEKYIIGRKKQRQVIPKRIHYFWIGSSKMPEQFQKNIETWKKYCPDYEIVFWNESNYDISKCNYMKEAYENKKWGFVSDYARLDIINTYGGIYLDTDVELLKPLDDLLGYDLFCGFESDEYVNFGSGFGGKANNQILKEMMKRYEDISFVEDDGSLNLVTCPIIQTQVLKKYGLKCDGSYQEIGGIAIFPKEFFSPYNFNGIGKVTRNTFSIHQYAATWFDEVMIDNKKKCLDNTKFLLERLNNKE